MSKPGVDADDHFGAGQERGCIVEVKPRGHRHVLYHRLLYPARKTIAALALIFATPRQNTGEPVLVQSRSKLNPIYFRPELVLIAARVQQDRIGRFQPLKDCGSGADAVVRVALRRVAQGLRCKRAGPLHCVQCPGNIEHLIVEEWHRLARAAASQAAAFPAFGKARDQCAFDQPLRIENEIVSLAAQPLEEISEFFPRVRFPQRFAPAPQCNGYDFAHSGMHRGNCLERFLHHPVNLRIGKMPADIAHHRQIVDDVPH